jgi:hypothetical protein
MFARDCADLCDRLNRAHLVVSIHDGDERCSIRDGRFHVSWVDHALPIDRDSDQIKPEFVSQLLRRMAYGMVFDWGHNNLRTSFSAPRKGNSAKGQVVTFGSAAREDHLSRCAVQYTSYCPACLIQGTSSLARQLVHA